eukprot:scaffold55432_cov20-Tisochrysis_lutea.AAC.1
MGLLLGSRSEAEGAGRFSPDRMVGENTVDREHSNPVRHHQGQSCPKLRRAVTRLVHPHMCPENAPHGLPLLWSSSSALSGQAAQQLHSQHLQLRLCAVPGGLQGVRPQEVEAQAEQGAMSKEVKELRGRGSLYSAGHSNQNGEGWSA